MYTRGFTLLEVIIYIALFSIIMGGASTASYALVEGAENRHAALSREQEGTFINRKLNWELTNASDVYAPTAAQLRIEPGAVVFSQVGETLYISRGGGAPQALSSAAHGVHHVEFSVVRGSGSVPASVMLTYEVGNRPFFFAKYLRQ